MSCLSKTVFKQQIERLLIFYPNWGIKNSDSEVMKEWYEMFKTFSDVQFIDTVSKYISSEIYSPTVAGLMAHKQPVKVIQSPPEIEYRKI